MAGSGTVHPVNVLWPREDPRVAVSFTFRDDPEGWRCTRVEVTPWEMRPGDDDWIDPALLSQMNLRRMERQARAGIYTDKMIDRAALLGMMADVGEDAAEIEGAIASFPRLRRDGREQTPRPGRPRQYDEKHFEEIGEIYNAARLAGDSAPLKAVAKAKHMSVSTAAKHVRRARSLGMAMPAQSDGGVAKRNERKG